MSYNYTFKRALQLNKQIKLEISDILLKEIADPRIGFTTITDVELTGDLKIAKIFYSVIGDEKTKKRCQIGLNKAKGYIKRELGKRLHIKFIPDIIFCFDKSMEHADNIFKILKEIEDDERDSEKDSKSSRGE